MRDKLNSYTYKPIRHDEVRLCRFVKETDYICAELVPISINKLPPYQTLSYAWSEDGKPATLTWEINVDGSRLAVLDSLQSFFKTMKARDLLLDGTWWWIDSMCINQGDDEERNHQVQMMRQLYSSCRACVVWLGTATDNKDTVVDYIHYLDKLSGKDHDTEVLRSMLRSAEFDASWTLLLDFLSRKWWNRVWTLQEFICPPSITFFYGTRAINRSAVCRAILVGDEYAPAKFLGATSYRQAWNRRRIWLRHINLDDAPPRYAGLTLPALAAYCCTNEATDERDRLYGLHGLITVDRELLQVEYSQSVEVTYQQYTAAFIKKHRSLDLCIYASLFPSLPTSTLPSWVPDWRRSNGAGDKVIPLMVSQSGNASLGNMRPIWSLEHEGELVVYKACGDKEAEYLIEGKVLSVRGTKIDQLGDLNVVHNGSTPTSDSQTAHVPFNHKDILTSVCRSLALDRKDRYLRLPMPTETFLNDFLNLCRECMTDPATADRRFLEWFNQTRHLQLKGRSLEDTVKQYLAQAGNIAPREVPTRRNDVYLSFRGRFVDTVKGMAMRMRVTRGGRIAIVPRGAQQDDFICVLYGCSVPVLLRRADEREDAYTLVGECYVDQLMSGEVLTMGLEEEIFAIC